MGSLVTTARRRRSDNTGEASLHEPLLQQPSITTHTQETPSSLWNCLFSPLKYIINFIRSIFTKIFHVQPPYKLSIIQQSRLDTLFRRASVQYDNELQEHRYMLEKLWRNYDLNNRNKSTDINVSGGKSEASPFAAVSERWKEMGWQSDDPSRDFRGGGFLSLECLVTFAEERTDLFHQLLAASQPTTTTTSSNDTAENYRYYYPFCAAGVNLVHMLVEVLHLKSGEGDVVASTAAGRGFLEILRREEDAFENVFIDSFVEVDRQWEGLGKEYMMFPIVLKKVKEETIKRLEGEEKKGANGRRWER